MDNRKLCGDTVIRDAPIPICHEHAGMLLAFVAKRADDVVVSRGWASAYGALAQHTNRSKLTAQIRQSNSVVYYVQVGDLIKIGTTTNLVARVNAYPPGSVLLATEPGDVDLERQRHQQFADCLAARNEWFTPTKRLMEFIAGLKASAA
jgi:hypothetical protein